jgi:hypothetical protein
MIARDLIPLLVRRRLPMVAAQWHDQAPQLRVHRLPSYQAMSQRFATLMENWEHNLPLAELWQELFDEAPSMDVVCAWWADAEMEFVERFSRSPLWFPLDGEYMGELAYSGDEWAVGPGVPILIETTAPNLSECGLEELYGNQPLEILAAFRPDLAADRLEYGADRAEIRQWARKWWAVQGFSDVPDLSWANWPTALVESSLRALPEPLNGFAFSWRMLVGSGNAFLDTSYEHMWAYCWCKGCVSSLHRQFEAVRDDWDAWESLVRWLTLAAGGAANIEAALQALLHLDPVAASPPRGRRLVDIFLEEGR